MPTRTTIKDAVIAAIKTDAAIASTRVYKGRRNTVDGANLPVVYVWQGRESIDTTSLSVPRQRMNMMTLFVDYWQSNAAPADLEDAYDSAVDKIEAALWGQGLNDISREDLFLTDVEYIYDTVEDKIIGCARLTFSARYLSTET